MFSAGALPFKTTRYSLTAIRHSLLAVQLSPVANHYPYLSRLADLPTSRLADNLARQEFRPPIFPVPRPASHDPF
jgi:hypothetical protein